MSDSESHSHPKAEGPESTDGRPGSVGVLLTIALAACVVVASYGGSLDGEFVLDDIGHIAENPHIRMSELRLDALREAAFESIDARRPLANITLAFNYYWGGADVRGYRLVNVLIHFCNGLLVYWLGLITFGLLLETKSSRFWPRDHSAVPLMSTVAALMFLAHPLQIQAVTYPIQRMTSLSVFFYLIALLCFLWGRLSPRPSLRAALWVAGAAAWLCAMASKQIAITLPVVIVLYDGFFFRDLARDWWRRALLYGALLGLVGAAFVWLAHSTTNVFDYSLRDFTMGERMLTQLRVVMLYFSLILYPHPDRLNLAHHIETSHSLLDPPSTLIAGLALLALVVAATLAARPWRLVSFAIFWVLMNLALESSFLSLEMIFEHRLYLPLVGVSLLAAYLLFSIAPERRQVGVVASLVVILALSLATRDRNRDWQSARILWADAADKSPDSFRARYDYAVALLYDEAYREALPQLEAATQLDPDDPDAHSNYGVALAEVGDLEEATRQLEQALRLDPHAAKRHYAVASIYHRRGKLMAAIARYQDALALDPNDAKAQRYLGAAQAEYYRGSK